MLLEQEYQLPEIVYTLLNTDDLWFSGRRNKKFIESFVVKNMFVRRDNPAPFNPSDRAEVNRRSVFFTQIRNRLADKKIVPIDAPRKTRNQIWDLGYVESVFLYWSDCINSRDRRKSQIAYAVNQRLTLADLYDFKNRAINMR